MAGLEGPDEQAADSPRRWFQSAAVVWVPLLVALIGGVATIVVALIAGNSPAGSSSPQLPSSPTAVGSATVAPPPSPDPSSVVAAAERRDVYLAFAQTAQEAYDAEDPDDAKLREAEAELLIVAGSEVGEAARRLADYVLGQGDPAEDFYALKREFLDAAAREQS